MPKAPLPVIAAAMLSLLTLRIPSAQACMGSTVLLQDNFQTMTANWGAPNDQQSVQGGFFVMKPALNTEAHVLNNGNVFGDMDACVDATVVSAGPQQTHNYAGLMWWGTDYNNYYEILVSPQGTYSVYRKLGPRWISIIDWTKIPAIKPGLNQVNRVRVVTKGTTATFYVNGTQLGTISGQPPQGGGEIGLVACSGPKTQSVWKFSKLKITD